jgi:hypothetical protein
MRAFATTFLFISITLLSVMRNSSTLLHSRKGHHWRIDIHRPRGCSDPLRYTVFLTGVVSPEYYRQRYMDLTLFQDFTRCLTKMCRACPGIVSQTSLDELPDYPNAYQLATVEGGPFRIALVLGRQFDGTVETILAVYDTDDDEAPMLCVTDREIAAFRDDCRNALLAVGVQPTGNR